MRYLDLIWLNEIVVEKLIFYFFIYSREVVCIYRSGLSLSFAIVACCQGLDSIEYKFVVSYPDLSRPNGCRFQLQLHGRIWVRDY